MVKNKTFWIKQKKRLLIKILAGGFLAISFIFSGVSAQTVDNLNDQKSEVKKKLEEINKQIAAIQQQIKTAQGQQASLKNEILIYDSQIRSTELAIAAKETQIEDTNLQIKSLLLEIEKRTKEIEDNKKILGDFVRELYELDASFGLNISFGTDKFSDFLDKIQYNQSVQSKVFTLVQNIKTIKAKLEAQEKELELKRSDLEDIKAQLVQTQESLVSQRSAKEKILAQTRGQERSYQALYSSSSREAADLQEEINELDKSIAEKLGNRTISPVVNSLAKPMDGIMTQGYGKTGFTALGYNFHNGIDWAAPAGTAVYAAADGSVVATDTGNAAYGNWVTIKHTISTDSGEREIITLYAHLRSIKVKTGQAVSQGTLIGYEGNTGNTTRLLYGPERGYHLHFTVFDAEGFGISPGKYSKIYGQYSVPYGYTYNPLDFMR